MTFNHEMLQTNVEIYVLGAHPKKPVITSELANWLVSLFWFFVLDFLGENHNIETG